MRNKHVPLVDPDKCVDCSNARIATSGTYYANCDGCVARALAHSPAAHAGLRKPGDLEPLKDLVRSQFPRDRFAWAATAVREWFEVLERQKEAA